MSQQGKLTMEQFCLAMWLIQQKVQGRDLPSTLAPEMVPPSLRPKEVVVDDLPHTAELEQIAKEIESLILEKRQLETEIAQKEADIRIRNGEVRNLQTELDTLSATFKQLETQKREAQKRLDDLDAQVFTKKPFRLALSHLYLNFFLSFCFNSKPCRFLLEHLNLHFRMICYFLHAPVDLNHIY